MILVKLFLTLKKGLCVSFLICKDLLYIHDGFISSTEPQSSEEYMGNTEMENTEDTGYMEMENTYDVVNTETENRNDVGNTVTVNDYPNDAEAMKLVQPYMAQSTPP